MNHDHEVGKYLCISRKYLQGFPQLTDLGVWDHLCVFWVLEHQALELNVDAEREALETSGLGKGEARQWTPTVEEKVHILVEHLG